jgi:hypothetical protein
MIEKVEVEKWACRGGKEDGQGSSGGDSVVVVGADREASVYDERPRTGYLSSNLSLTTASRGANWNSAATFEMLCKISSGSLGPAQRVRDDESDGFTWEEVVDAEVRMASSCST